jgi:hypothetical protein
MVYLFACLIIHTFQIVFSAETVFFSHNKSTNSTFSYGFSTKRTGSNQPKKPPNQFHEVTHTRSTPAHCFCSLTQARPNYLLIETKPVHSNKIIETKPDCTQFLKPVWNHSKHVFRRQFLASSFRLISKPDCLISYFTYEVSLRVYLTITKLSLH